MYLTKVKKKLVGKIKFKLFLNRIKKGHPAKAG